MSANGLCAHIKSYQQPQIDSRLKLSFTFLSHGSDMVIRRRIRAVLIPLALYCVAGALVGYFVWHAHHGQRGEEAKAQYKVRIADKTAELDDLLKQHKNWQQRIDLMQSDSVDKDLLEEEASILLDRVDHRDLVVFLKPSAKN
jgi:cell division protein FtsB